MTDERSELERLIEEQEKDDTSVVFTETGHHDDVSIDGYEDYLVADEDGQATFVPSVHPAPSGTGLPGQREKGSLLVGPIPSQYHGTIFGYRRRGCRCDQCKAAQAKAVRDYRAKKKEVAA